MQPDPLARLWDLKTGKPAMTFGPHYLGVRGVAFSPDGSSLLVTTKANGNDVDVFSVTRHGSLRPSPTVTSLPGAVPFAMSWDRFGRLVPLPDWVPTPSAFAATLKYAPSWAVPLGFAISASGLLCAASDPSAVCNM